MENVINISYNIPILLIFDRIGIRSLYKIVQTHKKKTQQELLPRRHFLMQRRLLCFIKLFALIVEICIEPFVCESVGYNSFFLPIYIYC